MNILSSSRVQPDLLPDRAQIETFLYREARLLDERRFEEWQSLFTADGIYWVPSEPEQTDPRMTVSIFYDDQDRMRTRIQRLRHPEIHVQAPPSRMVRIVSNIWLPDEQPRHQIEVKSVLALLEYRQGRQQQFGARVSHLLEDGDAGLRIRQKRVDLINADDVFTPLAIPF